MSQRIAWMPLLCDCGSTGGCEKCLAGIEDYDRANVGTSGVYKHTENATHVRQYNKMVLLDSNKD